MSDHILQFVYEMSDFDRSDRCVSPPRAIACGSFIDLPFDLQLHAGARPRQVCVIDQPVTGCETQQALGRDLTLSGVSYAAGMPVTIAYRIATLDGFEGYGMRIGNQGAHHTTVFVTNAPMQPAQIYSFVHEGNTGNTDMPYAQFACFTQGTLIKTAQAERPIEDVKVGDLVMTRDHGLQPVRWAARRTVPTVSDQATITFDQGVLGCSRPLTVSPNHRMLIKGSLAELYLGQDEAFVAARSLVNGRNIRRNRDAITTYVHIMFDYHEVIWAEDCMSESFFAGDHSKASLLPDQRAEMLRHCPDLLSQNSKHKLLSRYECKSHEGRIVAAALL